MVNFLCSTYDLIVSNHYKTYKVFHNSMFEVSNKMLRMVMTMTRVNIREINRDFGCHNGCSIKNENFFTHKKQKKKKISNEFSIFLLNT